MGLKYRIQERNYSPNVIEKGEVINGKLKWSVHIIPTGKKVEGDIVCEELFNWLSNSQTNIDVINSVTSEGLSCGLEDVGITDRYEAMEYGFEQCKIRVEEALLNLD